MAESSIEEQVLEIISDTLEVPRERLLSSRKLSDITTDHDDLNYVLEVITNKFQVEMPVIRESGFAYLRKIRQKRSLQISDVLRVLMRRPAINIETVTIGDLYDIVEQRRWPERLLA